MDPSQIVLPEANKFFKDISTYWDQVILYMLPDFYLELIEAM